MDNTELEAHVKAKGVKKFCRKIDEMTESMKRLNQELEKASLLIKQLADLEREK